MSEIVEKFWRSRRICGDANIVFANQIDIMELIIELNETLPFNSRVTYRAMSFPVGKEIRILVNVEGIPLEELVRVDNLQFTGCRVVVAETDDVWFGLETS